MTLYRITYVFFPSSSDFLAIRNNFTAYTHQYSFDYYCFNLILDLLYNLIFIFRITIRVHFLEKNHHSLCAINIHNKPSSLI